MRSITACGRRLLRHHGLHLRTYFCVLQQKPQQFSSQCSNISCEYAQTQGQRQASQKPQRLVRFVSSAQDAQQLAEELLSLEYPQAHDLPESLLGKLAIALDCEGVRLGRFGRVCLIQMALPSGHLILCDALQAGVVEALVPVLQSTSILKVMHDCREDSAALFHQHSVQLQAVFDTQAAHMILERRQGRHVYQVSSSELLRLKLGVLDPPETADMKALMVRDAKLWATRPLNGTLVRYALHGVAHMLALKDTLVKESYASRAGKLEQTSQHEVASSVLADILHASDRALEYRMLNNDFPTASSMAKIGSRLWGLAATRNNRGLLFKLNAGRVGLVCTPSALKRFKDIRPGDLALCCVSGVSMDGSFLYLDRYDHDWDYFDHQLRPSGDAEVGVYGREHRHKTTIFGDTADADQLFLRGLPALSSPDAFALDPWEADTEDMS